MRGSYIILKDLLINKHINIQITDQKMYEIQERCENLTGWLVLQQKTNSWVPVIIDRPNLYCFEIQMTYHHLFWNQDITKTRGWTKGKIDWLCCCCCSWWCECLTRLKI